MFTIEQSRKDRFQEDKESYKKKFTIWSIVVLSALVIITPFSIWSILQYVSTASHPPPTEPAVSAMTTPESETIEDSAEPEEDSADIHADSEASESIPDPDPVDGPAETASVTMSFVGDILLGSTVHHLLHTHGYDYPYYYVKEFLQAPDIMVGNLETAVTDRGEPAEKSYVFRSIPEVLPAFKEAGFDLVSLANNHILDYGLIGLEDTLTYLDQNDIHYVGAGMTDDEAYDRVTITQNGMKVAFLNFSWVVPEVGWKATPYQAGVADTYSHERPVREIAEAKKHADLVVVLVHWGKEREEEASEQQRQMAYTYIDAGADLIVGSHPHVLQGLEQYKGKWIAYSLGNFIFTTNDHAPTWDSMIFQTTCYADGHCDAEIVPIFTKWAQPRPMENEEAERLIQHIRRLSEDYGVEIDHSGRLTSHLGTDSGA